MSNRGAMLHQHIFGGGANGAATGRHTDGGVHSDSDSDSLLGGAFRDAPGTQFMDDQAAETAYDAIVREDEEADKEVLRQYDGHSEEGNEKAVVHNRRKRKRHSRKKFSKKRHRTDGSAGCTADHFVDFLFKNGQRGSVSRGGDAREEDEDEDEDCEGCEDYEERREGRSEDDDDGMSLLSAASDDSGASGQRRATERRVFVVPGIECVGCHIGNDFCDRGRNSSATDGIAAIDAYVFKYATSKSPEALWRSAEKLYELVVREPERQRGGCAPQWGWEDIARHYEQCVCSPLLDKLKALREMRKMRSIVANRAVDVECNEEDGTEVYDINPRAAEEYRKMFQAESREHSQLAAFMAEPSTAPVGKSAVGSSIVPAPVSRRAARGGGPPAGTEELS